MSKFVIATSAICLVGLTIGMGLGVVGIEALSVDSIGKLAVLLTSFAMALLGAIFGIDPDHQLRKRALAVVASMAIGLTCATVSGIWMIFGIGLIGTGVGLVLGVVTLHGTGRLDSELDQPSGRKQVSTSYPRFKNEVQGMS